MKTTITKTNTALKTLALAILILLGTKVNAQCAANFTFSIGANGVVSFTNTSSNTPSTTSLYWTDNNNYFSSAYNPVATLSNGYHIVCLTLSDSSANCFSTYCDSLMVTNSTITCNLNAGFNYTIGSNGNVSFASTSTGTSSSTNYNWYFGNNQWANTQNANTTYASNGWYTVCLFISDSANNCSDSYCDTITINNASNSATCNAHFTYTIGSNGNVTFASNSTGTTSTTNYYWSFNNSTWSSGPTTSATFTNYFNYVCLTIYDSTSWCYSTYCDSIIIPTNPCNANVNFVMVQDSTQALTWWAWANYPSNVSNAVWTWGDNSTSTGFYPSHTYSASGFYNICVTITVSCAGTGSFCANTFINKSADASSSSAMRRVYVISGTAPTNIKQHANTDLISDLVLYPNPAKDLTRLKVNMSTYADVNISIYEITGKLVQQQEYSASEGSNTIDIQTNSLNKGMYFVTLNSGNAKKTLRLIKQ
jgi:PKD repeat protein